MNKKTKSFNVGASFTFFLIGALFVMSDGASINANVVGASGGNASVTSIMGLLIIVGSIGLFIISMHHADHSTLDIERQVRQSNHHEHIMGHHETLSEDDGSKKEEDY
jgi:hypothetical protein